MSLISYQHNIPSKQKSCQHNSTILESPIEILLMTCIYTLNSKQDAPIEILQMNNRSYTSWMSSSLFSNATPIHLVEENDFGQPILTSTAATSLHHIKDSLGFLY